MNWTDDIIPRDRFYLLLKSLMALGIMFPLWLFTNEIGKLNGFFENDEIGQTIEFDGIIFSTSENTLNQPVNYVTIKELEFYSDSRQTQKILSQNSGDTKILGLLSYPSFKNYG